jgi:uncharacterized protein with HEPN domain
VSPRDDASLREILACIALIESYWKARHAHAGVDVDAIKYRLVVNGEAVARLSNEARSQAPDVPWDRIKGLRNFLVHQYDEIDATLVEDVIQRHLEPLAHAVRVLLAGGQEP